MLALSAGVDPTHADADSQNQHPDCDKHQYGDRNRDELFVGGGISAGRLIFWFGFIHNASLTMLKLLPVVMGLVGL